MNSGTYPRVRQSTRHRSERKRNDCSSALVPHSQRLRFPQNFLRLLNVAPRHEQKLEARGVLLRRPWDSGTPRLVHRGRLLAPRDGRSLRNTPPL